MKPSNTDWFWPHGAPEVSTTTDIRCTRIIAQPGDGTRYELLCYEQPQTPELRGAAAGAQRLAPRGRTWRVISPTGPRWVAFHWDEGASLGYIAKKSGIDNPYHVKALDRILRMTLLGQPDPSLARPS